MRPRGPYGKDAIKIPLKCSECKKRDMSLAIAHHMKWEQAEDKLKEQTEAERREQARRNEDLGLLARTSKFLGLEDTAEWFRKFKGVRGPKAARQASWPSAKNSIPLPGNPDNIRLESLQIRTPEPTYHPSISPLTPRPGNQSSAGATEGHKKKDETKILPLRKENKVDKEIYEGWPQRMDG